MDCFTRCCRDVTIYLTPYDILRLKNALSISSSDFLAKYTAAMLSDSGFPVVTLKMQADAEKSCPFVSQRGCTVYADRPWACRMYPLQPESTKLTEKANKSYYSVMDLSFCRGLQARKSWTLSTWIEDQGIPVYHEMENLFKTVTANERLTKEKITNKKIQEMYFMASYDLDRFRRFVTESTFLERFEVDPQEIERIKTDDVALFRFAVKWLEYGLLAQQVLSVKPEVMATKKQELGIE